MFAAAALAAEAATAAKYNVLYIIVDDLRPEFGAYGQTQMLTPNIDKLAASGTLFNKAYCQQAVCGPSRASFMTGRRPHHTRVVGNTANFREVGLDSNGPGSEWVTCPEHFKNNDWLTLGGGKTFHPNHPKNWDEPKSWSQDLPYFPFAYFKPNANYSGPCPGAGKPNPPAEGQLGGARPSEIDTW
jgi:iduronate 2-sulfatase